MGPAWIVDCTCGGAVRKAVLIALRQESAPVKSRREPEYAIMQTGRRDGNDEGTRRFIQLGPELPPIPESLLLAHARGEVLFVCGAGVSKSSGLPDFRELVCDVYRLLDPSVYEVLSRLDADYKEPSDSDFSGLDNKQRAEVRRFCQRDYDVVLGMLERRLDGRTRGDSKVRSKVVDILRFPNGSLRLANNEQSPQAEGLDDTTKSSKPRPSGVHKALMRLADRGGATSIVTTNFDLLLQEAARSLKVSMQTYTLGAIPRPSRRREFAGVFHIHGALSSRVKRISDLILTDQDFGEFYLRRRVVPDFIYDAARLFNLVLIGYSANDPPMRYLLNAVAADETRFDDLKDRYVFFGTSNHDPVELEDWKGRGIVPIAYPSPNHDHSILSNTLSRWAALSANNGSRRIIEKEARSIVKKERAKATEAEQGLFDHLYRRGDSSERTRMAQQVSEAGGDASWLDAMMRIGRQREQGRQF